MYRAIISEILLAARKNIFYDYLGVVSNKEENYLEQLPKELLTSYDYICVTLRIWGL